MDRDCNNCIHHMTGSCSKFNCDFVTVDDVRNKAIDEFAKAIISRLTDAIYPEDVASMTNLIKEIAEQLKAGGNS